MPARPRYDDEYEDDSDDSEDYSGYLEPHRGTTILVLGLLSILVCGLIGPFAWSMGKADLRKMEAGRMDPTGRGETQAGYICGMVATILMGIGLVLFVLWLVFLVAVLGVAAGGKGGP
ncbi:MAG TPA: DUF4190 domain-containing protein [Gemmataceae bacterium]|nr:DUF4190 domain-containing protein [Gemmataceae bacterium]